MLALKILALMLGVAACGLGCWIFVNCHISDADGPPYVGFDGRWVALGGCLATIAAGVWLSR